MVRARYIGELESVRENLIAMGDTTLALLDEALRAVSGSPAEAGSRAVDLESQTDDQHRMIHDQCLNLITLHAPVARDARLVTAVLDAIVDLELIGDYASEIAALSSPQSSRLPSQLRSQLVEIGARIREVLAMAVRGWRESDPRVACAVRPLEGALRAECHAISEKAGQLTSAPGDVTPYINLLLICRHLERILRHAVCVAEQGSDAARPAGAPPITSAEFRTPAAP